MACYGGFPNPETGPETGPPQSLVDGFVLIDIYRKCSYQGGQEQVDRYGVYGCVVVRTFPVCIGLMTMVQTCVLWI